MKVKVFRLKTRAGLEGKMLLTAEYQIC